MLPDKTDVLIVGAGPTGLALAIDLAQRGISFAIIDAAGSRQGTSRAAVVHARTLEQLAPLGVAERMVAQGIEIPYFRIRDRDRVLLEIDFRVLAVSTPFALMIPQDETEAILEARLSELGHQVLRPYQLTSVQRTEGGASATVNTPAGPARLTARYVVGADGEHSAVRDQAGLPFPGETYGSFLLADIRMDSTLPADEVTLFFSRDGMMVVAPMSRQRFRIVAFAPNAPRQPAISDVQAIMDARGPAATNRVTELLWGSRFQVHHKIAPSFRTGPFVLIGDAGHVHSPAGGQGMNLGLRDAVAAGTALAAALGGDDSALDRYAVAQHAAATAVLRDTERLTRAATVQSRFLRQFRNVAIETVSSLPPVRERAARLLAGYG